MVGAQSAPSAPSAHTTHARYKVTPRQKRKKKYIHVYIQKMYKYKRIQVYYNIAEHEGDALDYMYMCNVYKGVQKNKGGEYNASTRR